MRNRPKIVLYVTSSIDGRITTGPNRTMFNAEYHPNLENILGTRENWNTYEEKILQLHNSHFQMEGSNMLVGEKDELKSLPKFKGDSEHLYHDYLPNTIVDSPDRTGWLAIIDGRGRVRFGYKGELDKHTIHLTTKTVDPEYLAFLQENTIPYLIAGENRVDLDEIMYKIKHKLGINVVVTSSGGKLAGALMRHDLLDEVNILINPVIIGGLETPSLFDSSELAPPEINPVNLELIKSENLDNGRIWLRYKVN